MRVPPANQSALQRQGRPRQKKTNSDYFTFVTAGIFHVAVRIEGFATRGQ